MTQTQTLQSTGAATVPAIELRGLTKSFGSVRAVRGIDLTVRPGEIIAFLGPNGAGKTTTIDMMLGLSRPDEGTALVYGMEPSAAVRHGLI
jgi:ABC-2 type transport system ATP-binding protein